MSASLRQRQPRSKGKAARVAEYIRGEVPVPQGCPAGNMLRKDDRQLAAIVLSVIQAAWFITISVGIVFYAGDPSGVEKRSFHSLVWFDRVLRVYGPIFPFLFLATRYKMASLAPDILAFDDQPWVEQLVVYVGITATRLLIYLIHRLGVFYFLTKAGAVSALPAHLMSDHVFLGSALVAMLSAEAVFLARDVRHAAQRLSPLEQSIVVGAFLFCALVLSLIDGDMYYTCRFYHAPIQNFWAVILGLISFQLPLSWWLIRGKSGQVASLWTPRTPAGSSIEMQKQ